MVAADEKIIIINNTASTTNQFIPMCHHIIIINTHCSTFMPGGVVNNCGASAASAADTPENAYDDGCKKENRHSSGRRRDHRHN